MLSLSCLANGLKVFKVLLRAISRYYNFVVELLPLITIAFLFFIQDTRNFCIEILSSYVYSVSDIKRVVKEVIPNDRKSNKVLPREKGI